MYNWYLEQAKLRQRDIHEEARQLRLQREARSGGDKLSPAPNRLAARLGGLLIVLGRRLQGHEAVAPVPPAIVVLGMPTLPGQSANKR